MQLSLHPGEQPEENVSAVVPAVGQGLQKADTLVRQM